MSVPSHVRHMQPHKFTMSSRAEAEYRRLSSLCDYTPLGCASPTSIGCVQQLCQKPML